MTSINSSTIPATMDSSSPSAITRIRGSVPDLRIRSRPLPSSRCSAAAMALLTISASSGCPPPKRTLRKTCGKGSKQRQTSLAGRSVATITASTCRAASRPSAGGRVIAEHDMARLLAADIEAVVAHMFDHVAVADRCAGQRQALRRQEAFEPQIGHHGGDQPAPGETAMRVPIARDQRHQLVAVDQRTGLIGDQHPVGVAVERDAQIRAVRDHRRAHGLGMRRAAIAIDVCTRPARPRWESP